MDTDIFEFLSERTKETMGDDIGGQHAFIDDLTQLWRKRHDAGLSVFHFTHILLSFALGTSINMAPLEDAEAFARFTRDRGEATRKIISDEWPPPDRTRWPYTESE